MMDRDAKGKFSAKETKFNSVDIVRLKSGGPFMTVVQAIEGRRLLLAWFDDQKSLHQNAQPILADAVESVKSINPADDPAFHWKKF